MRNEILPRAFVVLFGGRGEGGGGFKVCGTVETEFLFFLLVLFRLPLLAIPVSFSFKLNIKSSEQIMIYLSQGIQLYPFHILFQMHNYPSP